MSYDAAVSPLQGMVDEMQRNRALVEGLIDSPARQDVMFQPIADIASGEVVAYRSRILGRQGSDFNTAAVLAACEGTGLLERLDWSYRVHVLDSVLQRGLKLPVHMTPEPITYGALCPPRLAATFGRARRELSLGSEIPTAAFSDVPMLLRGIDEQREWGWRIVCDDIGDSAEAVAELDRVRPDWIRVDFDLPGRNTASLAPGVRRMLDWATANNATVMGHGVDSAQRKTQAAELGATVIRGLVVGPPAELPGV